MAVDLLKRWRLGYKTKGYVYLLKLSCEYPYDNVFKIGFALDALKRFRGIQESLPFPISVVSCYLCADAWRMEAFVHLMFNSKRFCREWYRLDPGDIQYFDAVFTATGCRNGYWVKKYMIWYRISDSPDNLNNNRVDDAMCRIISNTVIGNVYRCGIQ